MRSTICRILLALMVAACSSGGYGGPTDPGNGNDDIRGTYDAVHRFVLTIAPFQDGIDCPGSLRVTVLSAGQL